MNKNSNDELLSRIETQDEKTSTFDDLGRSFEIINKDTLKQTNKPNAIVRPVQRKDIIKAQKVSMENDFNEIINDETQKEKENDFRRKLNAKLNKYNIIEGACSQNTRKSDNFNNRPLFITTVPKGIFLDPPNNNLKSFQRLYTFASHPRIYNNQNDTNFSKLKNTSPMINGIKAIFIDRFGQPTSNINRRIVKGNTCYQSALGQIDDGVKERRRKLQRCMKNQRNIIGTPPPVAGRKHENVQTEHFLEEIFLHTPEKEIAVQTSDLFIQRPPMPPYVPEKRGIDRGTEILEGELFNFDLEVQPIIETLVGHTVQQGLIEILHEEEMTEMKRQHEEFLALREAEKAEIRRLEAEEERLKAEKERRIKQDAEAKENDRKIQEEVTAAKLLQGHVANLVPEVIRNIETITKDEKRAALERKLCSWLTTEVSEEVGHIIDSREILTEIVKEILQEKAATYKKLCESGENIEEEEAVEEEMIEDELE